MLKVDVEKRASCREVHQFLASSYEKCLRSRQYATARLPTFLEQGPSLDVETIESIRDDTTPPSITTEHPPPVLGSDTMSQIQSSSYPSVFDNDDSVTIYSVSDIPETRVEHYVSAFAEDLYKQMEVDGIHSELIEKSSIFLPTLLQAFAFTLAYELPSKSHREVMVFIHKYRHEIATAFKEKYQQPIGVEDIQPPVQQQRPTLIMERFLNSEASHARFIEIRDRPGSSGSSSVGSLPAIRDDVIQEDDIFSIPGMEEYVALISKAPGYEWLLSRLHREISLSRADHDSLRDIHDTILRAIPRNKEVSKKRSSYNARITYNIDWDILAFLRGQDYGEPDHEAISLAITITGSWTTCQALTARQYLEQTWPLTGLQTLKFLQQLLLNTDHDAKMTYDTPSHLELEGFFRSKMVIVTASGIPEFVAEVGEQLAWLGAALRPTDSTLDILPGIPYICVPHVLPAELHSEVHSEVPVLSCSIRFTAKRDKGKNTDQPGNCWRHLFHGPVIAGGFPIPNRAKENTGLEIPLDMLVALTRALYIDTFKSKVFIKGYNTMLVPIECSGSYLVWHLLYSNEPLQRISYLDGDDIRLTDVKLSDVPQYRHVLGWCADSVSTAGTIAAAHPIGKSGLSPAHANSVLEKVEIQAGQIVNVTAIFALGCREKPLHLTRPGYFDKLDWLLTSYFIFWDQGDRKGWLVTGASALLHILCGYLKNGQERYGANWLLDPDKLFNNADISNANYALNILMSERNRQLPLYTDLFVQGDEEPNRRPRYYTLQDKINHICSILEKSVDHQLDMRKSNGLTIKATPKRQLNGWDFRDLVISADPCSLRVANLETVGRGWTDLARELNAVTLFGKGFGELIRPKDSTHTRACRWSSVPSGSDYLVARVSDLHTIMDDKGDPNANPRVLIGDVHWHVEECTFQQCPCNGRQNAKHHEPVQRLFPRQVLKDWGDQPRINLEKDGAVIFGHTLSFPTHFRDSLRRKPKKLKSPFFKKWSLMKKAAKPG
ncbi:hypothetical protein F5Y14DRAFT_303368 [Nemania sp. NC0429]|nr:hypothetical protein F5Y14DRAFT_303368 [Nemania sp. NC0429]